MSSTTIFRRLVRRTIPLRFRQGVAQLRRRSRDRKSGAVFTGRYGGEELPVSIRLAQPIMPSAVFQAKLSNLRRGAELLDRSMIEPGELWSFWERIGKPEEANGFLPGRNIVDGRLVLQVGGGLCQLSSLIYHLALLGGLEIAERHHHSIDIYREEDRFTPLGADATVVWGFKDLRLRNPYAFPVSLGCRLHEGELCGEIRGEEMIPERNVSFLRERIVSDCVYVRTVVDEHDLCETRYLQRQGIEHSPR